MFINYFDIIIIMCIVASYLLLAFIGYKFKKSNFLFANGKGTVIGKTIFSIPFAIIIFACLIANKPICCLSIVFLVFICLELLLVFVQNELIDTNIEMILTFGLLAISFLIVFKAAKSFNIQQYVFIIIVAFIIDLIANLIGKLLKNKPKYKLQYPNWISPKKSFTAALIAVIVTSFLGMITNIFYNLPFNFFQTIFVGFGAVIGDAIFSFYKRIIKISDFPATIGPIGGILDRIDSWIFAFGVGLLII